MIDVEVLHKVSCLNSAEQRAIIEKMLIQAEKTEKMEKEIKFSSEVYDFINSFVGEFSTEKIIQIVQNELDRFKLEFCVKKNDIFLVQYKGIEARGYRIGDKKEFVVLKGSQSVDWDAFDNFRRDTEYEKRQQLIDNGVLVKSGDHFVFTKDHTFSSPSLAGTIIMGTHINGLITWKNSCGEELGE